MNLYGLELEARLRQQQAVRHASLERLGSGVDRGPRRGTSGLKWKTGGMLMRLGKWLQGGVGAEWVGSDVSG